MSSQTTEQRGGRRDLAALLLRAGLVVALVLAGVSTVAAVRAHQRVGQLSRDLSTVESQLGQQDRRQRQASDAVISLTEALGVARADTETVKGDVAALLRAVSRIDAEVQDQSARQVDTAEVARSALPSVVVVECGGGLGSGFSLASDPPAGHSDIVTNFHVVEQCGDPSDAPMVSKGSTRFATELVATDVGNDLALLRVEGAVPPLELADSPTVGDPVVAIGSPLGLRDTVTTGIVSNIRPRVFQTSAAINPGNSGGPLLDREGKVLGVNTRSLEAGPFSGFAVEGIAFAVRMRVVCQAVASCS